MTWHTGTLYGFDTESTGVDVFNDRIVTATIVKVVDGELVDQRHWLINPGIDIPPAATAVHGITTEVARSQGRDAGSSISEIVATIVGILKARVPLVAFNAAYDLSILEVEAARHNTDTPTEQLEPDQWHTILDPFVLGKGFDHLYRRKFVKGRSYKLPDLCHLYKVPFTESHDSTQDALGAVRLAVALANYDGYFAEQTPAAIHQMQKTWRREMQNSLRAYFDKQGIEHDGVDAGWPLHTNLTTAGVPV